MPLQNGLMFFDHAGLTPGIRWDLKSAGARKPYGRGPLSLRSVYRGATLMPPDAVRFRSQDWHIPLVI